MNRNFVRGLALGVVAGAGGVLLLHRTQREEGRPGRLTASEARLQALAWAERAIALGEERRSVLEDLLTDALVALERSNQAEDVPADREVVRARVRTFLDEGLLVARRKVTAWKEAAEGSRP